MIHEDITEKIIGCAFEVIKELGTGFLESVYEKAMIIALKQKSLNVKSQYPIDVFFRDEKAGEFYADILVEDKIIVELKTVRALLPEHQAQVINYLRATGMKTGLLINFGNPKLEVRRLNLKSNPAVDNT